MFWKRIGLNQKEPPHISGSELLVRSFVHRERGRDVHETSFLNAFGMIETEPVGHAGTAIMSCDQEALVTVVAHHIDLILGHGAK